LLDDLKAKGFLDECTLSQVKNQVTNLKRKYTGTIEWKGNTGQGVLEEHGEEYLQGISKYFITHFHSSLEKFNWSCAYLFTGVILKQCPHFEKLHEIYGERLSINPPFVFDSSASESQNIASSKEKEHEDEMSIHMDEESAASISANDDVMEFGSDLTKSDQRTTLKNRKRKSRSPVPSSGSKALSQLCKTKLDMHAEELQFSKAKWESEKMIAETNAVLERERFLFSKEIEEQRLQLEQQRVKDNFELEKYRIDQEMNLKLEIAKLQFTAGRLNDNA